MKFNITEQNGKFDLSADDVKIVEGTNMATIISEKSRNRKAGDI